MNSEDLDMTLRDVFATVMGIDPEAVSETTTPLTVGTWTSLRHLSLVAAVEEAFDIHFSAAEINESQSFGAIRHIVSERLRRASKTAND